MIRPKSRAFAILPAAALVVAACGNPQATSEMKAAVEQLQAQQKDILTKLDSIEKGQKDLLAKSGPARPAAPDPNKRWDITVGKSYAKGPESAAVTIVEWSDFQCPFCAQAATLMDQVIGAYPNDVRFVYKNYPLPFHQQAMPAAKAAVAAGKQGKFFEMHDKLFTSYKELSEAKFATFAQELGLDVEQFKKDMAAEETASLIAEEMKQAGEAGVRGTPSIFINGKQPQGRSLELYKSIIDEEIKAKKKT